MHCFVGVNFIKTSGFDLNEIKKKLECKGGRCSAKTDY